MRNKYMRRGILLMLVGVAFTLLGYYIMDNEDFKYGWAMIIGVSAFGIGFLSFIYSLIRKVERKAILEERAADAAEQESANG